MSAVDQAVKERDAELILDGRQAVGTTVGLKDRDRDEFDQLMDEFDAMEFLKFVRRQTKVLNIGDDMLKRAVNVGFSGGEKKRAEVLQMAVLEPTLAVLDETDSGLDVDALRIVGEGVTALRSPERSMLVITHYQRLLDYIIPDVVHVLSDGKIVDTGDKDLAVELEKNGYASYSEVAA